MWIGIKVENRASQNIPNGFKLSLCQCKPGHNNKILHVKQSLLENQLCLF